MRKLIHNGVKTVGLAAAIAAVPCGLQAEDGLSVSWGNKTKFKGGKNKVDLSMKVELTTLAFYHDQDDEYNRDAIYRSLDIASTPSDWQDWLNDQGSAWADVEHDFADGIKVRDAELYLKGKAYDRIFFCWRIDAKKDVTYLDKWHMGIQGIPMVGKLRLGEVRIDSYLSDTEYLFGKDEGVAMITFESQYLIGLMANNSFLDGRLWYQAAAGMKSGEPGRTDGNWDVQLGVYGTPLKTDAAQLDVGLSAEFRNPHPSAHTPYSDTVSYDVGIIGGPDVIGFEAATESNITANASVGLTVGRLWVQGNYTISQGKAPTSPDLESDALMALIATGDTSTTIDTYNDWDASGGGISMAVSLTGEPEQMGGGIKKPNANLAFDGSGFGAFEAVARYQMIDVMDDAHNQVTVLNPMAGITSADILSAIMQQSANRMEGGEANQFTVGLNWYPTPGFQIGMQVNQQSWNYDEGAVSLDDDLVTGIQPMLLSSSVSMAEMLNFVNQSSIENDYSSTSVVLSGRLTF